MSAEQLQQMMVDADPDRSGEIDFEEFLLALQKQTAGSAGGLTSLFTQVRAGFRVAATGGLTSLTSTYLLTSPYPLTGGLLLRADHTISVASWWLLFTLTPPIAPSATAVQAPATATAEA